MLMKTFKRAGVGFLLGILIGYAISFLTGLDNPDILCFQMYCSSQSFLTKNKILPILAPTKLDNIDQKCGIQSSLLFQLPVIHIVFICAGLNNPSILPCFSTYKTIINPGTDLGGIIYQFQYVSSTHHNTHALVRTSKVLDWHRKIQPLSIWFVTFLLQIEDN